MVFWYQRTTLFVSSCDPFPPCNVGFDLRASFCQPARAGAALSQCRSCPKSAGTILSAKATKDTIPHRAWVSFVSLKRWGAGFSRSISLDGSRQFCFTQRARRLSRGRCSHLNASVHFDGDKGYEKSCALKNLRALCVKQMAQIMAFKVRP
jgi:hypothetical protein